MIPKRVIGRSVARALLRCLFYLFYAEMSVYLQLNKKKAKAEGKRCHAKTMLNTKADKAQSMRYRHFFFLPRTCHR
jgi:hypothetical protein